MWSKEGAFLYLWRMLWCRVCPSRHSVRLFHWPRARFSKDPALLLWSTTYLAHLWMNGSGWLECRWCPGCPKFALSKCLVAVAWTFFVSRGQSCWSLSRGSRCCQTSGYSRISWHSLVSNRLEMSCVVCWSRLICSLNRFLSVQRRPRRILVQEHQG